MLLLIILYNINIVYINVGNSGHHSIKKQLLD